MDLTTRPPLLTASLYFVALGAVIAALYAGVTTLAPAVQSHFLRGNERPQSRIDQMVANAREIRQALARPITAPEPLPPITARSQRAAEAKPEPRPEHRWTSRRPSMEARSTFAMWQRSGGGATTMGEDRYRPQ